MKTIGIVVKSDPEAIANADALEQWLTSRGVSVTRKPPGSDQPASAGLSSDEPASAALSCVFVLGGDGTFLSAARWIGDLDIPLIGIKFGQVGFLAETVEDDLLSAAEKILNNNYTIEERMRLQVTIFKNGDQHVRQTVLNDVVINKGALARLAHIRTRVNDYELTTYRCDGLIVSTPTGSTAYSLAAGGPIIHPSVQGIILSPICPFTLTNRPLVVPETARIELSLAKKPKDIMVTLDGQEGYEIDEKDSLIIEKAPHPVKMIVLPGQRYFDVLKAKLQWGEGPG